MGENRAAFEIAVKTLNELRKSKHCSADMYTYPAMFKSCERLLLGTQRKHIDDHDDRMEADLQQIREIFSMCCEDGLLDSLVVNNLSNFLHGNTMRSLLGISEEEKGEEMTNSRSFSTVKLQSLPKSWRRNIYTRPHGGRENKRRREIGK